MSFSVWWYKLVGTALLGGQSVLFFHHVYPFVDLSPDILGFFAFFGFAVTLGVQKLCGFRNSLRKQDPPPTSPLEVPPSE